MERLLVVDDEEKIRAIIRKYGEFEGYIIDEATDGIQTIKLCKEKTYDLIIMDVMMPELDGFSTCTELKKFINIPIIMLSARGEEYDKIHGFGLGIDDYVVKPFSPRELMMRVKAVLARTKKSTDKNDEHKIFQKEGLKIDFTSRVVTVDDIRVDMTPKEYDLLFFMVENKGIALTRDKLLNDVWGYDYYGDDRTLDTHIKLLRNNLGEYRKLLVTLRGVGYRFEA